MVEARQKAPRSADDPISAKPRSADDPISAKGKTATGDRCLGNPFLYPHQQAYATKRNFLRLVQRKSCREALPLARGRRCSERLAGLHEARFRRVSTGWRHDSRKHLQVPPCSAESRFCRRAAEGRGDFRLVQRQRRRLPAATRLTAPPARRADKRKHIRESAGAHSGPHLHHAAGGVVPPPRRPRHQLARPLLAAAAAGLGGEGDEAQEASRGRPGKAAAAGEGREKEPAAIR